jgi:hypothetical protein
MSLLCGHDRGLGGARNPHARHSAFRLLRSVRTPLMAARNGSCRLPLVMPRGQAARNGSCWLPRVMPRGQAARNGSCWLPRVTPRGQASSV